MSGYIRVVFNHPLREEFTYSKPDEWDESPLVGSRILAPFSNRPRQIGFITDLSNTTDLDPAKIKKPNEILDETPVITPNLMKLVRWITDYYFCSMGETLFAAFPFGTRTSFRQEQVYVKGPNYESVITNKKLSPKRRNILELFAGSNAALSGVEIRQRVGVGPAVIKALLADGALVLQGRPTQPRVSDAEMHYQSPAVELNTDQVKSVQAIAGSLQQGQYHQYLLHGVTGSGKTEVFLRSIDEALSLGKTTLVLVPEIALTPQTAARYRGRFPGRVEVLHSGLTQARRFEAWMRVREGNIPIVVGTRSAVFSPLENLGLIIVDEEHDSSYKQSDPAPRYHARDVACYRGMIENAVVVLGSATPSLESYENVLRKKSSLLHLPKRATAHALPQVELVDMRHRPPTERVLSSRAREAIEETLSLGLQSILFLNRRGHSTQLQCRDCGKALECQQCSVTLVWHSRDRSLRCHHCGYSQDEPEVCPNCRSAWIRARGFGTEQVLETISSFFPSARSERIDLDVTQEQGSHDRILSRFRKGEIDLLVGTQMVSKGLDMPGVRLVVVVQAETSLNVADFRASERSFSLLTQVAGRAGRGEHPGLVVVQSYAPNHYSILTALRHDYLSFRRIESRFRKQLGLPPHTRLMNIRVESEEADRAEAFAKEMMQVIQLPLKGIQPSVCRVIGPTPCPLEKLLGRWRWQILLASLDSKIRNKVLDSPELRERLLKPPAKTRLIIDVDPISVL